MRERLQEGRASREPGEHIADLALELRIVFTLREEDALPLRRSQVTAPMKEFFDKG